MKRSAKPQIITDFGEPPQPLPPPGAAREDAGTPVGANPADATTATSDAHVDGASNLAGTGGKRRTPKT